MNTEKEELSKIKDEALDLIKKNTYKEQLVKDSLLILEDMKNIKSISTILFMDFYSSDGVRIFQGKIFNKILRIISVENMLSNDTLTKYKLDGYIQARQKFSISSRSDSYYNSGYYRTDKWIALKTLFKYDKQTLFNYHVNKKVLLTSCVLGLGLAALNRFKK